MLITIVSFVFVLGVLIFIHELGHFLVAKRVGIRVDRFSLGFPPNIFSRRYGETEYCVGMIPLGGYVKMAGENPDEESTGAKDEFMSKSILQRAAVILAGPFMNYVLAVAIMIGIYLIVGEAQTDPDRALVGVVSEEGPAQKAGIANGDQIIAIDGEPIGGFSSMRDRINSVVAGPIQVSWLHEGDTVSAEIVTAIGEVPNMEGGIDSVGIIGIEERAIGYRKYGLGEAVSQGFNDTHRIVAVTASFVKQLVFGEVSTKMLGGPLFIAQQSGKVARRGFLYLMSFMALLSINLAVLNVLPIPVLDGGHLVFLGIEAVKRSPLSMKARMMAQQVGMVVLLGLIVFVTYNDILRLFGTN